MSMKGEGEEEKDEVQTGEHGPGDDIDSTGGGSGVDRKIKIDILWGLGYIWDAEDEKTLKSKYNIQGRAVGAVPGLNQQNDVHGLPVQIQAEAVAYLAKKGVVEIVSEEPKGENGSAKDFGEGDEEAIILAHLRRKKMVEVPLVNDTPVISAAGGGGGSGLDVDPQTLGVFGDVLEKGYAITDGGKFGAKYLLYDGQPSETHAIFTLKMASYHEPIDLLKIISAARVAHAARKNLVLASAEGGNVHYLTFSPEGGFQDLLPEKEKDEENDDTHSKKKKKPKTVGNADKPDTNTEA